MKIQLDTTAKVIKLESSENLGELITALEQMLPNGLWKEFKLETNTTITWTNPIIWRDIYVEAYRSIPLTPYIPTYPYSPTPWITYETAISSTVECKLNSGVYNVEC